MDWVSKGSFKGDLEILDKSGKGVGKIFVAVKFERPGERHGGRPRWTPPSPLLSATSKRERAKNIFCRSNENKRGRTFPLQ